MSANSITPITAADNCYRQTDNPKPATAPTGPTGPRTPEGKSRSSLNALKLGLSIQRHVILPFEDPAEYEALRAAIHEIYEPQSAREVLAIDDVAHCRWAFRRFDEAEATALAKCTETWVNDADPATVGQGLGFMAEPLSFFPDDPQDADGTRPAPMVDSSCWKGFQNIHRYRTWWERKHSRALAEFERARQARRQELRDAQTLELHALRLADAARKEARERQREQQREAAERRREELHALRLAHQQQRLLAQQQATAERQARARVAQLQADFESLTLSSLWDATSSPSDASQPAVLPQEFVSRNPAEPSLACATASNSNPTGGPLPEVRPA